MNPRSIRVRLATWYFAVLAVGMIAFCILVWFLLRHDLVDSLDDSLAARSRSFIRFLEQESHGTDLPAIREEAREYSTGLPLGHTLRVWGPDGALLFASPSDSDISRTANLHQWREQVVVHGHGLNIEMGAPLEDVYETLSLLRTILLSCVPLVLALATAGGWWVSRRALEPVDAMTAAAEAISVQDLSRRLSVPQTGDELERFGEAWNRMLDRIAAAVQQMTRFTADAAHELRTPIAIIRSGAELALRRDRDAAAYRDALTDIQEESARLTNLVDELMWLVRSDAGVLSLNVEDVCAEDFINDVRRSVAPLAERRQIVTEVEVNPVAVTTIRGDRLALRSALLILLDNAIKFSRAGGAVRIRILSRAGFCRIEVQDSGYGVPEEHLPHIFERFYRADTARSSEGFGLGLSIAKAIVDAHHGVIGVSSSDGQGSTFYVELPIQQSTASLETVHA